MNDVSKSRNRDFCSRKSVEVGGHMFFYQGGTFEWGGEKYLSGGGGGGVDTMKCFLYVVSRNFHVCFLKLSLNYMKKL